MATKIFFSGVRDGGAHGTEPARRLKNEVQVGEEKSKNMYES